MKAMILAAGLGTRLRPLTDDRPKALVEVGGRTLLEIALARLNSFGIREVILNVHHFADKIVTYLQANHNFGMEIAISREEVLLDTGGGLKKAAYFFLPNSAAGEDPFILHNVGAWRKFTLKIEPSPRSRYRSGRRLATCSSTIGASFAVANRLRIVNPS